MRNRLGAVVAGALLATTASVAVPAAATTNDVVGGGRLGEKGVVVTYLPGATPLPAVVAGGWLLADADTGEVLASKGAHRRLRPASTIKTLTALTLLDRLDPRTVHEVAYAEAAADGGKVGIVPGARYTVRDLLHGMLLPSGNDAAEALAAANGGREQTIEQMQAVATELQALDTTVRNPSGLDEDGQLTSAYDLALIARAALAQPAFAELTAAVSYDFPGRPVQAGKKRPTYKIYTQNRLLTRGYDGAVGGKTGYTSLAGRTYWGAATRDGRTLMVTLLRAGGRTEDGARALLDWGFANAERVTPVGALVGPASAEPSVDPSVRPAGVEGVAASASVPAAESDSAWLPWAIVGVLLMAGAVAIWWGRLPAAVRRSRSGDHAAPSPRDSATHTSADAPVPSAAPAQSARPAPPAQPVGPVQPASDEPAAPEAPTDPVERARPAHLPGGHVRVMRPGSRPGQPTD